MLNVHFMWDLSNTESTGRTRRSVSVTMVRYSRARCLMMVTISPGGPLWPLSTLFIDCHCPTFGWRLAVCVCGKLKIEEGEIGSTYRMSIENAIG